VVALVDVEFEEDEPVALFIFLTLTIWYIYNNNYLDAFKLII
jgi:hypothetical protein